jgi:SAM-dependent methyltransferase
MYETLKGINTRPQPYEFYTADILWTDEYISQKMLTFHLDKDTDLASRKHVSIDNSVDWTMNRFNISQDTRIADFGCGPGLYCARWAEKGARVTGIDFSRNSIEYARKAAEQKRLNIDYVHMDYLQYETAKKFDLITMIYCDFCALSPEQRKVVLGKFHSFLDNDGCILLDVCSLNFLYQRAEAATYGRKLLDGFWAAEDYFGFLNTFKYEEQKVLLDKYTIFEQNRVREVYNWLQCFSTESIINEFADSGLKIMDFYSNVAGAQYCDDSMEFAVVAVKA